MKRLLATLGVAGLFATSAVLMGGTAGASTVAAGSVESAGTASVSVVHGIPNTPVNVFVNDVSTLANFQPSTVAGPLDLPPGTYDITVFPAANTEGTGTPLLQAAATVAAGDNVTLVAHLTAGGMPTITPYANDLSGIAAGQARLVVRHDAAAPAVDVRANGTVAFAGLTNPAEATADLAPGTISADVVLAGTTTVAIGPADLTLAQGTATFVYAVGSAAGGTLGLVTQVLPGVVAETAGVSVVHGIPNTPVNVFVNGESTLPNFQPLTVAGPLMLPPGTYDVTVFPAADTEGTGTPILQASATVAAGDNVTLVAHLTAGGTPTITPYANDVAGIVAGQARLVVRHTAAAPAVDVRANGAVAFSGLTNPGEATADLAPGTISADVVLAGTTTVAIGPADLTLSEGTSTIVYAVGSAAGGTLGLVTQVFSGMTAPTCTVSNFTDVPSTQQFATEISWLACRGITQGWVTGNGVEFRPVLSVDRAAMAAFLYRLAGSPDYTAPEVSPFVDVRTTSQFYREISWLAQEDISTGWVTADGAQFRPQAPVSRSAIAAFLYRFAQSELGEGDFTPPATSPFSDVTTTNQFYREISWLAAEGISTGYGSGASAQFRTANNVDRQAMAAFMYRLAS